MLYLLGFFDQLNWNNLESAEITSFKVLGLDDSALVAVTDDFVQFEVLKSLPLWLQQRLFAAVHTRISLVWFFQTLTISSLSLVSFGLVLILNVNLDVYELFFVLRLSDFCRRKRGF